MTNRVPPLHPASPPPFSKLSFYEEDVDENDDFANYSIATPDIEEKIYRGSSESNENGDVTVDENFTSSSCPSVDTPVIEDAPIANYSNDFGTLAKTDTHNDGSKNEMSVENETWSIGADQSAMITNGSVSVNSDEVRDVSMQESNGGDDHLDMDDDGDSENSTDLSTVPKDTKTDEIVNDNSSDALSTVETKESIPLENTEENDSVAESSDDSSAVINEAAFIVVENESDVEEDIFDDGFQDFSDYKTDSGGEIINACSDTFPSFRETYQAETKKNSGDDQFLSTVPEQAAGASCQVFDKPTETELVTLHNSQIFESHQNPEPFATCEHNKELVDENDDFDDFVSPPLYETQSTEQFALDSGMNLTEANELKTLNTKEHNSNIYAADCWSDIFEYNGEDQIEVNLNTLEGKLNGSSIWCQIKNIETSPALKFNWNESETKKLLLATLGVDLRNILFGPRWNSEVPRFASNLKFSPLVPEKASSDDNFESQHSDSALKDTTECTDNEVVLQTSNGIRDAHFDWTSSGLTNPLDAHSHSTLLDLDLLANFDIHSPYYKEKRKSDRITKVTTTATTVSQLEYDLPVAIENSTTDRGLSTEATRILSSLPDLIVMEKQYIVFPIR